MICYALFCRKLYREAQRRNPLRAPLVQRAMTMMQVAMKIMRVIMATKAMTRGEVMTWGEAMTWGVPLVSVKREREREREREEEGEGN